MTYDTIYAAQDLADDINVGVKSPLVKHGSRTKLLLLTSTLTQVILLVYIGLALQASHIYFIFSCAGGSMILGKQLLSVDLADPNCCKWWFKRGCIYTGTVLSIGFIDEYVSRSMQS